MDYSIHEQECNRINKVVDAVKEEYRSLYEDGVSKVVRNEIGLGGELMHRGYYCPSLIADIIAGNVKRGRIVKTLSSPAKEHFDYGFDKDNKLVTVRRNYNDEVIIRDGNKEMGIIFSQYGIEAISETIYVDNKLISYGYYLYCGDRGVFEYQKETYTYTLKELVVDWVSYSNAVLPLVEKVVYTFKVVDGYMHSYKVNTPDLDGNAEKLIPCNPLMKDVQDVGREYEVRVRRKVNF